MEIDQFNVVYVIHIGLGWGGEDDRHNTVTSFTYLALKIPCFISRGGVYLAPVRLCKPLSKFCISHCTQSGPSTVLNNPLQFIIGPSSLNKDFPQCRIYIPTVLPTLSVIQRGWEWGADHPQGRTVRFMGHLNSAHNTF